MEAARPTQTVLTSGRIWRIVSNTAMPASQHTKSWFQCDTGITITPAFITFYLPGDQQAKRG
jgi:hypothetical protein